MSFRTRLRFNINRLANFIRPAPKTTPLKIQDILASGEGLEIVDRFRDFYYSSGITDDLKWRGIPLIKNPCDLWTLAELIGRIRPGLIIETGTHYGGSAAYCADMANIFGLDCTVVTIDINPKFSYDPEKRKIVPLVGFSTDSRIVAKVEGIARHTRQKPIMVMLDSDHTEENVLKELMLYSPFVTRNSYLIVEDTNINGHPSFPSHGPGPWEAVDHFLKTNNDFVSDKECEKHLLTFNPSGWLKRIKGN